MNFRGEEDYIKQIYQLESEGQPNEYVQTNALVQITGHALPSVNEMIKRLVGKGLLEYKRYTGVRLTNEGIHIAQSIIHKHRIWETFLHDYLNFGWDEIHDEAEALEHITSNRLAEALYNFMAKPQVCPHGNPIDVSSNQNINTEEMPLTRVISNGKYIVLRVKDTPDILDFLTRIGLKPGMTISIHENDPINELITLKNDDQTRAIGYRIAKAIIVIKE